jgi:hypothetical protein
MPIRQFWLMNDCIERIRAEEDLRSFTVANRAQAGKQANDYLQHMQKSVGKTFVLEVENQPERDEAGINDLKRMAMR